jgi:hypothetical protein
MEGNKIVRIIDEEIKQFKVVVWQTTVTALCGLFLANHSTGNE